MLKYLIRLCLPLVLVNCVFGDVVVTLSPTSQDSFGTRRVNASVSASGSVDQSAIPSGVPLITFHGLTGGTDSQPFSDNLNFGQSSGDFTGGLQLADNVNIIQFHFVSGQSQSIVTRMQNLTGGAPNPIPYNTTTNNVLLPHLNYSDLSPGTYVTSGPTSDTFGGFTLEIEALPLTLTLSPGAVVNGVTTTTAQFTQGNAAVPQSVFMGGLYGNDFLEILNFEGNPFDPYSDPDTGQTVLGLNGTAGDRDTGDAFFNLGSGLEVNQFQFLASEGEGDGLLLRTVNNTDENQPFRLDPDSTTWSLLNLPFDQLNPGTYAATGGNAEEMGGFNLVIQSAAIPEPSSFLMIGLLLLMRVGITRHRMCALESRGANLVG